MSYAIEVRGGSFASAASWLEALRPSGYRVAFRPGDPTPALGGALWLRLGHPSLASDRDVVACITFEVWRPARDAPPEVIADRAAYLERLRALNAPWTEVDHHAIVLAWLRGGSPAVVERIEAILRERRALGAEDDEVQELVEGLAWWRGAPGEPPRELSQSLIFHGCRDHTEAEAIAWWLLAAGYAAASGGVLVDSRGEEVGTGAECLERVESDLARVRSDSRQLFDEEPPPERLFESWEAVEALAAEDEEDDEYED
jgi:hypothetical protein